MLHHPICATKLAEIQGLSELYSSDFCENSIGKNTVIVEYFPFANLPILNYLLNHLLIFNCSSFPVKVHPVELSSSYVNCIIT